MNLERRDDPVNPAPPTDPNRAGPKRRWLVLLFGVLIPLYGFAALAEDIWTKELLAWDAPVLNALHRLETPALDRLAVVVTFFGSGGLMALAGAALAALLAYRGHRSRATFVALAVVGAGAIDLLAKFAFLRARPRLWVSPIQEIGYSFPSGHAMGSMAMVAALAVLAWRTRWRWLTLILGGVFVAVIGLTRLYLGVHYPSDVLAGWGAAIAWVSGVNLAVRRERAPTILDARVRRSRLETAPRPETGDTSSSPR